MRMQEVVRGVLAHPRERLRYPVEGIEDALNFGFRYMESQDHMVDKVVVHPDTAKRILGQVSDSTIDPTDEAIGRVWTASLLVSRRVDPMQIMFVNSTHSVVLDIDVDPYTTSEDDGDADL